MTAQLKISILTPCFNAETYLSRAIESTLAQDYPHWEHIVFDGGSTDGTLDILKQHTHIQWVSAPDAGQSDAMNKAFEVSRGDLIVYLNADDYFKPQAFSRIISEFEARPETDMLIGDLEIRLPNETIQRSPSTHYRDILTYWKCLFPANPVSYFYRRHVQEKIGPFPLENHYTMDYWFLLHAYKNFQIRSITNCLGTFWLDGSNKTSTIDPDREQQILISAFLTKNQYYTDYSYFQLQRLLRKPVAKFRKKINKYFKKSVCVFPNSKTKKIQAG